MAVSDAHVSWLSRTSTKTTFFPKPPACFLTCLRGERRKYARKFASTPYKTHKHQVISQTCSQLSQPCRALVAKLLYKILWKIVQNLKLWYFCKVHSVQTKREITQKMECELLFIKHKHVLLVFFLFSQNVVKKLLSRGFKGWHCSVEH